MKFSSKLTEDEESAPTRDVSRHFEDTSYGYKDFSRHGMHVPTFRVQVMRLGAAIRRLSPTLVGCATYQTWKFGNLLPRRWEGLKQANKQPSPASPRVSCPEINDVQAVGFHEFISEMLHSAFFLILRIIPGKTMAIPWLTVFTQMWDNYLMRSFILLIIWLTTQWPCTKTWIPQCYDELFGTIFIVCLE